MNQTSRPWLAMTKKKKSRHSRLLFRKIQAPHFLWGVFLEEPKCFDQIKTCSGSGEDSWGTERPDMLLINPIIDGTLRL